MRENEKSRGVSVINFSSWVSCVKGWKIEGGLSEVFPKNYLKVFMCTCTHALLSITQVFDSLVSLNFMFELAVRFCTIVGF